MHKLSAAITTVVLGILGTAGIATAADGNYELAYRAVCHVFGKECPKAMSVVKCETGGTYSPWAQNGQYLGIFQMGDFARRRFGHGNDVWSQARAAKRYYDYEVRHGYWGWSPWSCA